MDSMESRLNKVESDLEALKKTPAKTSSKSSGRKSAPSAVADAPKEEKKVFSTRREAIDDWCQKRGITEADRKAFGEAKRAERELQHKAYEMTCKQFNQYVAKSIWTKQYEINLAVLKAGIVK